MLSSKTGKFVVKNLKASLQESDFYKLNFGHTGFYRTLYESQNLQRLISAVKLSLLSTTDMIGFLSDAEATCLAGKLSFDNYIQVIEAFIGKSDYQYVHDAITVSRFYCLDY